MVRIFLVSKYLKMIKELKNKMKNYPQILIYYGGIKKNLLKKELSKYSFEFPKELIEFWIEFGSGDLFQTETILSPIPSDKDYILDIIEINNFLHNKGLDKNLIVFHENASEVSAFDVVTQKISIISNTNYLTKKQLENIDKWFEYLCLVNE